MTPKPAPKPFFESPSARLYLGDAIRVLRRLPDESVDVIFADPPYLLSNGGVTCQSGRLVSVDKGSWDASRGFESDYRWNRKWLAECQRLLKPDGTIWVSGTLHNIYLVGYAIQSLGFKMLNDICWYKPNAAPNLSCRYFTHSHETVLWAAKSRKSRHGFHYEEMKAANGGRQMRTLWPIEETPETVWSITPPKKAERTHGKHPTQKPIALLRRIITASTAPGHLVLDPFVGSGTTCVAALELGRQSIGIDAERDYLEVARARLTELGKAG